MKSKSSVARFLYAASEQSADVFYLCGVFVPDAFLCGTLGSRSFAIVNRLEYRRVKANSHLDEVYLLETEVKRAAVGLRLDPETIGPAELIRFYLKMNKLRTLEVPTDFPAAIYAKLHDAGLQVEIAPTPFFPGREIKSETETKALRSGSAVSAAGIQMAEQILRASRIVGKRLIYKGATLTSGRLRCLIDQTCLAMGAVPQHTIVAGGCQACDPHESGHGSLRPHELIIIDVFPRVQKTGYHGDMTRTFLRGKASDAQRALVAAVQEAHRGALAKVKSGVSGGSVHKAANDVFIRRGFRTEHRDDGFVGFIHSTGHGLGLEVHEPPQVSLKAPRLRSGQVITIEPGLYYPEIGGCRIEDVVRVTKDGSEKLSRFHYRWELQ